MRKFLPFLILTALAIPGLAKGQMSLNPYPNELSRFKFYAKYLDPLRPYVTERTFVAHVLGSSIAVESENWRIVPHFVGAGNTSNGHPWASDITGRLASVE